MSRRALQPVWGETYRAAALARLVQLIAVKTSTHFWTREHHDAVAEIHALKERLGLADL